MENLVAPQRFLAPHLADAVRQAKIDSGMSWRELGRKTGRSHAFLVQISNGQRVPGIITAQRLIDVLKLDPDIAEELLAVAPLPWWEKPENRRT